MFGHTLTASQEDCTPSGDLHDVLYLYGSGSVHWRSHGPYNCDNGPMKKPNVCMPQLQLVFHAGSEMLTDIERQVEPSRAVLCLALVATREIEDEELLLNYRLSPGLERPSWYTPVDRAEDNRRWS